MKLHELGAYRPTEQVAKTLKAFMGEKYSFDRINEEQARYMLGRVRGMLKEYKTSVSRHFSERNPDYLKLVMLEQALTARLNETAGVSTVSKNHSGNRRRLREASDVQQAQVVMAAQDMVDQIQKMMEQISSMQFKDLPALVDAIKNEVGVDQANRFQADATAALGSLLTAVQGGKTQMEAAQGVLTGQAPTVPGTDMGAAPMPAGELGAEGGEEDMDLGLDANLPPEEEEGGEAPAASLGRERR